MTKNDKRLISYKLKYQEYCDILDGLSKLNQYYQSRGIKDKNLIARISKLSDKIGRLAEAVQK